ncbi:Neurotransmitter-gated ion-channel transmembrane domain, partial [Trinorchestia longiramus]
ARVVRAEQVSFNFFCDFDLTIYPFGVYPCLYNISLIANSETDPYFDLNNTLVELPSQRLSLFVVRYSAFSAPDNDTYTPRIITVTVLLEGLYGGFILSIFMPCVVITFIGISTLFFAYDNFQDRITVTLSCLIVEAGLYSQVTDIVPISAAPKFIDVFFLYAITRLFITCVNHMYCYRFLIWLDRRRAALAAKKLQFTEDVLSISRASKPLPTHRPTSSLVSCQSSETNNGEPNSKLGVSSMAPKIS